MSSTPPAFQQGPAADHPGTRTIKKNLVGLQPSGYNSHAIQMSTGSPASQTRFQWSGGITIVASPVPGGNWACWETGACSPAGYLFTTVSG